MLAFGDKNETPLSLGNDTRMNSTNTYIISRQELKLGDTRESKSFFHFKVDFREEITLQVCDTIVHDGDSKEIATLLIAFWNT